MYIEENPVQGVETILDIGTGTGGSAFVLGQLFPEVHIIQIICDKKQKKCCSAGNTDFSMFWVFCHKLREKSEFVFREDMW